MCRTEPHCALPPEVRDIIAGTDAVARHLHTGQPLADVEDEMMVNGIRRVKQAKKSGEPFHEVEEELDRRENKRLVDSAKCPLVARRLVAIECSVRRTLDGPYTLAAIDAAMIEIVEAVDDIRQTMGIEP